MNDLEILRGEGFRFKKGYGQNFLTDGNLLSAIVTDAGITRSDTVVEVGPGAGSLTRALAGGGGRVIAYEIDESLRPVLARTLTGLDTVEVIFHDILKVEPAALLEKAGGAFKVVANLPYYLTTPVLFYFLENFGGALQSLTVMVQKEVAERMTATAERGDYGALSASIAIRSSAKIMRQVGRQCFTPQPNVDSAVVRLDMHRADGDIDYRAVAKVIRAGFSMRRKTLANNLAAAFALKKTEAEALLAAAGIPLSARAETVSPAQFIRLSGLVGAMRVHK